MERLALVIALAAAAVTIAWLVQRRRPDPPSSPPEFSVPTQLDRADFPRPEAPWLVALFSSSTCEGCASMWTAIEPLTSDEVATVDIEVRAREDLHTRYAVGAVPTTVLADAEGVVRASVIGPVPATELWSTVAAVRDESAD